VATAVAEADARVGRVAESITSLETRSQSLEGVPERVRLIGLELDQRQAALDRASEHLKLASALRHEAAEAVQRLDERALSLHATLADVETRAKRLQTLSVELDVQAGKMQSVQGLTKEFESQFAKWEVARLDLRRSLDQLEARRSTVDTLQVNITQMFELAERTADDIKAAAEAQREIRESRTALDDVLGQLREVDTVTAAVDRHRQEIEKAEQRLARAQALLLDIHSSLETLNNQKALLDHVIEQAGSLSFQVQQAEVLIDRLRKERDITTTVRTALEDAGVRGPRPKRDA
jgi:chromosome segregation ATPase